MSKEEAEALVRHVMYSLSQVMDQKDRQRLAKKLPKAVADYLRSDVEFADPFIDEQVFVGPLVNDLTTEGLYDQTLGGLDVLSVNTGDEATRRLQAVFAALKECLDETREKTPPGCAPGRRLPMVPSTREAAHVFGCHRG